jgi:hypothetical protein
MSKHQKSNKEAKKPKQDKTAKPVIPAGTSMLPKPVPATRQKAKP